MGKKSTEMNFARDFHPLLLLGLPLTLRQRGDLLKIHKRNVAVAPWRLILNYWRSLNNCLVEFASIYPILFSLQMSRADDNRQVVHYDQCKWKRAHGIKQRSLITMLLEFQVLASMFLFHNNVYAYENLVRNHVLAQGFHIVGWQQSTAFAKSIMAAPAPSHCNWSASSGTLLSADVICRFVITNFLKRNQVRGR